MPQAMLDKKSLLGDVHCFCLYHKGVCPEPGGVPFSMRSSSNGPYNPGDQVTYRCYIGGGGTRTCQSNGVWTQKPTCPGELCLVVSCPANQFYHNVSACCCIVTLCSIHNHTIPFMWQTASLSVMKI